MSTPIVENKAIIDPAVDSADVVADRQPELAEPEAAKLDLASEPEPIAQPPNGWGGRGQLNKPTVVKPVKITKPTKPSTK
ncbi:uncharacterized protein B0H18DRAFT_1113518 [Fomitopsis serialis]|uniref:uncharacterized protein n=1 Tax=Fomitopsis serialis TaxID=139415 RepID=UPI0020075076|nr:uncharacterized protein B0H18DRAFT_1113518 [Neoantrodia serialis]KAH9937719.1 hypothetical protein B0H18DRAFT_1113518 [Neoantrodia serialis]